ncbi:MAG: DUF5063 domain-containing protein [Bacteroidales bacterium]|nr:DUF5063 domain-containing protein [Bacteroidales bacterium]HOY39003.1 DUF5063 domain-containing protein [Bacteroidales bacterium]HQP03476.1 DUF5063 domain-containing protein [Bacteroidales bacterium]
MTEPMENHPSLSKHVVEFLLVAKEYVSFSETPQHFQQSNYIDTCLKLFSMLYLKALFLPDPDEKEKPDEYGLEFVNAMQYERIKANFEQQLGEADAIVPFRDAGMINTDDYVNTSISELLADVYQDVANFVEAFRIGEPQLMDEARVKCSLNFKLFWGPRLIVVLDQLHRFKYIENNNN